jgi:hypothetical protein
MILWVAVDGNKERALQGKKSEAFPLRQSSDPENEVASRAVVDCCQYT